MNALPTPIAVGQETVLVRTRLSADAKAIARTLENAGIPFVVLPEVSDFCTALPGSLGAVLTIEVLTPEFLRELDDAILHQPPWSDVPIILLTSHTVSPNLVRLASGLGNVTILERPLRPSSLLSVVRSAGRARRRQFEVAQLLGQNASLNEQLRRSMTETHHRVKNNLQLIAALVDLTAMEAKDSVSRDELLRLGSHIGVLASIHDILTEDTKNQEDGTSLSVKAVLEKLVYLLNQALVGRCVGSQIEDIRLSTRHCTSLAVIANELVSNALKYTTGDVEVVFRTAGVTAFLIVRDNGAGFPPEFDPLKGGHTGLDLVLNLSRHDLNGTVHFSNEQGRGGCVTVRFPIS